MLDGHAALLSKEIEKAMRTTFADLCKSGEHFYYCTLVTSGDGGSPCFSAWSKEALESIGAENKETLKWAKWSYADSPYCLHGEENWKKVRDMWLERPHIHSLSDEDYYEEIATRIKIMVLAMRSLDREGLFELNQKREDIVINVEFMPPDKSNTERAYMLNPPNAIRDWLIEAAE